MPWYFNLYHTMVHGVLVPHTMVHGVLVPHTMVHL